MSDLELLCDRYETEYPSLVREVLAHASADTKIFSFLTEGGQCALLCLKTLFIWSYDSDDGEMPHAFRLNLPHTGLQYTTKNICIYKQTSKSLPSVFAVSPEGCIRHWNEIGKPHKDYNIDLKDEVAHSIVIYEAKDHVHRFVFTTTTSTFFIIEAFHDGNRSAHLTYRPLDLNTQNGLTRRMSVLLFGSPAADREIVVKVLKVKRSPEVQDAQLMVVFHKVIRFYSVSQTQHLFGLSTESLVVNGLQYLGKSTTNVKHFVLDAVFYRDGLLLLIAVVNSAKDCLDFYLGYIDSDFSKTQAFTAFSSLNVPDKLAIQAPLHAISLPQVTIHSPTNQEAIIVFSNFIVMFNDPTENGADCFILDKLGDQIVGSSSFNRLSYVILKENGICALRKLPKHFDLTFWKKNKKVLEIIYSDFLGKDFIDLRSAFFTFASKDLERTQDQIAPLRKLNDQAFASLCLQFAVLFLDHEPANDLRWNPESGQLSYESNKAVIILSQLKDKLAFYKMFFLFLNYYSLFDKINVQTSATGEKTTRTAFLELGEKLQCMIGFFDYITRNQSSVVESAVQSLAKVFSHQYDHPVSRHLTFFDHFFKEVSHFDDFIPEVVKTETEELEQCLQDYPVSARVINEVGGVLSLVADVVAATREASWTTSPTKNSVTWLNDSRFLRFFDQHIRFAVNFLGRDQGSLQEISNSTLQAILNQVLTLTRLVLDQDKTRRKGNQIISQLYEIGHKEIALTLAEEFEDFDLIIRHSHTALSKEESKQFISNLKDKFKGKDFDLVLYDYYRRNGMVDCLLEEKGERLENFLKSHENINWIRNIEKKQYQKARSYLKNMMMESNITSRKATIAALGKFCALCEDQPDLVEVTEFTEVLKLVEYQENIDSSVAQRINPTGQTMTANEIISVYLQEQDCVGFMKAILLVYNLISSPYSEVSAENTDSFLAQIYTAIFKSDSFEEYDASSPEIFEAQATCSNVAAILKKIYELDVPNKEKVSLLPNLDQLDTLTSLDSAHLNQLRSFLQSELSTIQFCIDENQMES